MPVAGIIVISAAGARQGGRCERYKESTRADNVCHSGRHNSDIDGGSKGGGGRRERYKESTHADNECKWEA